MLALLATKSKSTNAVLEDGGIGYYDDGEVLEEKEKKRGSGNSKRTAGRSQIGSRRFSVNRQNRFGVGVTAGNEKKTSRGDSDRGGNTCAENNGFAWPSKNR